MEKAHTTMASKVFFNFLHDHQRSQKDNKSLALVSQRFRRLVVDFQVEEVELSVDQIENKKPDIDKRWNPNLKNNLNKWEKPMSIEKLHTMLRDHPRLRGKCRSLMVSINDGKQTK